MDYLFELQIFGLIFQLITAIVGSIYFYKYKNTVLKYFLIVLWYVGINDILGLILKNYFNFESVTIIYNIYYLVVFSYFMFLFKNYVSNTNRKKWIFIFIVIYILSLFINSFIEDYLEEVATAPYIIGASFVIISIIFYYIDILNSEKVLYVNKNLLFWISIGVLIYYAGNIPFRIVRNYVGELIDASIQYMVLLILTFVMNTCFIIGFIWSSKKQQY
ncbi:hypothetical protein [Aquimarina algiphila]|uniref:hypothetical protein n=1 Tax=Aquimarina algiphila TaxID=2047982 RepID=UPI00232D32E4|nr:hypothetical protein [Aquimarina algiphila]